jgi:hypothetical protein
MSFYMITDGLTEIEMIYIGRTAEEAIANARPLIDQWHEYASMTDEEVREIAEADDCEFDLVEIDAPWPGENWDMAEMVALYERQHGS